MNALVVFAHPDPESYNRTLADAVVRGLSSTGHQVTLLDLYALDYAGALSPPNGRPTHPNSRSSTPWWPNTLGS